MNLLTPHRCLQPDDQRLEHKFGPGVLSFAAGATLVSGVFFGLIPAWRVTRTAVAQALKDQAATTSAGTSHVGARKMLVAGK